MSDSLFIPDDPPDDGGEPEGAATPDQDGERARQDGDRSARASELTATRAPRPAKSGGDASGVDDSPRRLIPALVILAAAGIAIWAGLIRPSTETRRQLDQNQSALAETELRLIQISASLKSSETELTDLKSTLDIESLRKKAAELREERGKLAAAVGDLTRLNAEKVDRRIELDGELKGLESDLTRNAEDLLQQREEFDSLEAEITERRRQALALIGRMKKIEKEAEAIVRRRENLEKLNADIREKIQKQTGDFRAMGERLIAAAKAVSGEREKLLANEKNLEQSRRLYVDGLAALNKEFTKIAARNIGLTRQRYRGLALDTADETAELDERAPKLNLAEDEAGALIKNVEQILSALPGAKPAPRTIEGDGPGAVPEDVLEEVPEELLEDGLDSPN